MEDLFDKEEEGSTIRKVDSVNMSGIVMCILDIVYHPGPKLLHPPIKQIEITLWKAEHKIFKRDLGKETY